MFVFNKTKSRQIFFICLFFLQFSIFSLQKVIAQSESEISQNTELKQNIDLSDSKKQKIEEIIKKANELKLYEDKYWKILLSYDGNKSNIVTPAFFLAPDGRTNPKAELEANIRAFLNGESIKYFPARFKWIKEKLSLTDDLFPKDCEAEYFETKKKVNPTSVHVVFPGGYMKNPASMFGHTFLLFENEEKPRLMGETMSYGAIATDTPGFIYAVKGLFGLYYGQYLIEMYSKQTLNYRDLDMRDIWEYKLKLTDEQLDNLFRHAMEFTLIGSKYFYIGENCTFYTFAVLDAAYPDEDLTGKLGLIAEPLKSIKILDELGLIENLDFKPSLTNSIDKERKMLGSKSKFVKKYCIGKISTEELDAVLETPEEKTLGFKIASEYLRFLLTSREITQKEYQDRVMPVFKTLSKLKNENIKITSTDYPHKSHDSKKIAITSGIEGKKEDICEEKYTQFYFRLVNHDLIDNDLGLNKNTQLAFLSGAFSIYAKELDNFETYKVKFDNFYAVNIVSLPVTDSFFSSRAIDVKVGFERTQRQKEDEIAFRGKFFLGKSYKIFEPNQIYFLCGLDAYANPNFDYFVDILPGAEIGLLTQVGIWKQQLIGLVEQGIFMNNGTGLINKEEFKNRERLRFDLSAEERFSITRNTAISAKYSFYGDYKEYKHKLGITAHFNF